MYLLMDSSIYLVHISESLRAIKTETFLDTRWPQCFCQHSIYCEIECKHRINWRWRKTPPEPLVQPAEQVLPQKPFWCPLPSPGGRRRGRGSEEMKTLFNSTSASSNFLLCLSTSLSHNFSYSSSWLPFFDSLLPISCCSSSRRLREHSSSHCSTSLRTLQSLPKSPKMLRRAIKTPLPRKILRMKIVNRCRSASRAQARNTSAIVVQMWKEIKTMEHVCACCQALKIFPTPPPLFFKCGRKRV